MLECHNVDKTKLNPGSVDNAVPPQKQPHLDQEVAQVCPAVAHADLEGALDAPDLPVHHPHLACTSTGIAHQQSEQQHSNLLVLQRTMTLEQICTLCAANRTAARART